MDGNVATRFLPFSSEALANSRNVRVKKVFERLQDKTFLDSLLTYSETYWDKKWTQTW
jgi:hypothetical protein